MEKKFVCVVILFVGLCHGVSKASECTARGRFPNDESADCRGYTMCLLGGLTNFTQYKLKCPMGSVYSHLDKQCTNATNYKCFPNFNCTGVGNFAVPDSTDCSSYVACIEGLGSVGTARVVQCSPNKLFDSTAGVCVNNTDFTCTTLKINVVDLDGVTVAETTTIPEEVSDVPAGNAVIATISFSMFYSIILLHTVLK